MALAEKIKSHEPIEKFYANKSVFITGGTGFLGKVLIEKLLYSCPNIDKIYLLIREKQKYYAADRIKQMLNLPIFQRLQKERPEDLKKLVPVSGDIVLPSLGICKEDETILIEKVSCVFHCAANIKFNQSLKIALHVNYEGTRNVLHLCQRMNHIEVFVYISTAFSNTDQPVLEEIVYPPPASIDEVNKIIEKEGSNEQETSKLWTTLLGIISNFTNNALLTTASPFRANKMWITIPGCRPNTYTFVKALTETLVNEEHGQFPSIIIRPSIVSPSISEPLSGWVDNWFGATGLMTAIANGANRLILSKKSNIIDLIPVNYVSNLIIVATARANKSKDVLVYNSCSGAVNPLTIGNLFQLIAEDSMRNNPHAILRPMLIFLQSELLLRFLSLILETIPAFLLDCWLRLMGKPPRYMKMKSQVTLIRDTLQYFTSHSWVMMCSRTRELFASLSSIDKTLFPFEPTEIVWSTYIPIYYQGIRKFLLNKKVRSEYIST